ncbi:MAG: site-2 protease family protein [Planctomycetaceae bacterium]
MTSADDENDDIVDPSPEPLDDASQVEWIVGPGTNLPPHPIATIVDNREIYRQQRAAYQAHKRRQFRISVILFVLTLCSTFLVASGYVPFRWLAAKYVPEYQQQLERVILEQALEKGEPPGTVDDLLWEGVIAGLMYSIPLMSILFCHEMGHYLQSVRNRVPASFPYFIPLPLPPLGTMGAVILQGRGVATRRQMFDIAVSGPIAGLVVTIPVLLLGIYQSHYETVTSGGGLEFGEPLLLQWAIHWIHGPGLPGQSFMITSLGLAGWVGVFITAMNLLPVGQLDGGHILYTLIGRKAHTVAYLVIAAGLAMMLIQKTYTFSLLLMLLMLTGLRHPPTANDHEPLGIGRAIIGWLTLSFLIIGFTPNPIAEINNSDATAPAEKSEPVTADYGADAV